jgi:hypothetical protein
MVMESRTIGPVSWEKYEFKILLRKQDQPFPMDMTAIPLLPWIILISISSFDSKSAMLLTITSRVFDFYEWNKENSTLINYDTLGYKDQSYFFVLGISQAKYTGPTFPDGYDCNTATPMDYFNLMYSMNIIPDFVRHTSSYTRWKMEQSETDDPIWYEVVWS